jgi:hypothetical protein
VATLGALPSILAVIARRRDEAIQTTSAEEV